MFRESSAIDSERTAASVRSLYSKYASTEDNWFDGTPDSIDRRIAQCKRIANLAKAGSVRLSGRNASSQYIALAHEMDGDRKALEGLRRDLLTAGMDREDDDDDEFGPGKPWVDRRDKEHAEFENALEKRMGKRHAGQGISPEAYEYIKNRAEGGGFAQSVGGRSPEAVIDFLLRQQEGFKGTPYYDGHHPDEMVKGWQAAQCAKLADGPECTHIFDFLKIGTD
jgi:hypothetical protein